MHRVSGRGRGTIPRRTGRRSLRHAASRGGRRSGSTTGPTWCSATLTPSPGARSPYTHGWPMVDEARPLAFRPRREVLDLLLRHVHVGRQIVADDLADPRARGHDCDRRADRRRRAASTSTPFDVCPRAGRVRCRTAHRRRARRRGPAARAPRRRPGNDRRRDGTRRRRRSASPATVRVASAAGITSCSAPHARERSGHRLDRAADRRDRPRRSCRAACSRRPPRARATAATPPAPCATYVGLVVGEPEDPRSAMARSLDMALLELLEQHDVATLAAPATTPSPIPWRRPRRPTTSGIREAA